MHSINVVRRNRRLQTCGDFHHYYSLEEPCFDQNLFLEVVAHVQIASRVAKHVIACDRLAAVHHQQPQAGHRAVQGGCGGLHACTQCPPGRAAGRMAGRNHRNPCGLQQGQPRQACRALCHQPDRAQEQRPPGARHAGVRQVQGADRHHVPGRARRCEPGGAQLGWCGAARHHQQQVCPQGD